MLLITRLLITAQPKVDFSAKRTNRVRMTFASRLDAGEKLGAHLRELAIDADSIAGLPRGGVIVAAAAAHVLSLPLDILVVRKIGHPLQREYAVGALAEGGVVVLDEKSIGSNTGRRTELQKIILEEALRLKEYEQRFHPVSRDYQDRSVLLIDDGLATGATTEAAVLSARKQGARRIVVAAPVASISAVERLLQVANDVIVLFTDPDFDAVGRYYQEFSQTTDEEVLAALRGSVPT